MGLQGPVLRQAGVVGVGTEVKVRDEVGVLAEDAEKMTVKLGDFESWVEYLQQHDVPAVQIQVLFDEAPGREESYLLLSCQAGFVHFVVATAFFDNVLSIVV